MSGLFEIVAVIELVVIVAMALDNRALGAETRRLRERDKTTTAELARVRQALQELERSDARIVDQLMERGRQEVERLEAYYRTRLYGRSDIWPER